MDASAPSATAASARRRYLQATPTFPSAHPARFAGSSIKRLNLERPLSTSAMSRCPTRFRSPASSSTRMACRHPESRWSPITTGIARSRTDKNGRFTVHGVGRDLKILQLQSNDYFSPKPFDVAPGRTDLKLTVIKAYEIHGTAVDAETGKPVPIDTVRLCRLSATPTTGTFRSSGD